MAIHRYTDQMAWAKAALDRGLLILFNEDKFDDNPDNFWEPYWAAKPGPNGQLFTNSPLFGCFQNIPTDELGVNYTSEGFLADTHEEYNAEMTQQEARHDALTEVLADRPTLH